MPDDKADKVREKGGKSKGKAQGGCKQNMLVVIVEAVLSDKWSKVNAKYAFQPALNDLIERFRHKLARAI